MSFCFHTKTGGIRTREGMSVIRMSGEHSNSEWSEGDRAGAEEAACKRSAVGGQVPHGAPIEPCDCNNHRVLFFEAIF